MPDIKIYKQADLVLQVHQSYDPAKLDLEAWEEFLDMLCGVDREFQKEAIRNAIIFLASGRYKNIQNLVKENYGENKELKEKYISIQEYEMHLQIPNKLFANIDLATGTGKSYVIYGIAQIMLGLGLVDRVLVLCPSLTIESGLTEKFMELRTNDNLQKTIPENAQYKNLTITDANYTVQEGSICVENIHSVYGRTGSSIDDSFKGQGERVLVLNDESHHIFNRAFGRTTEARSINRWKEFLINPEFNFKYILGFTGTAYFGDEYFNDIIYRYSLRQAIDAGVVKKIEYVQKDDTSGVNEKFQKIYENHITKVREYPKIKPLTILVTGNIENAKKLYSELLDFLKTEEGVSDEEKVLIVTSASEHKSNLLKLKTVDEKDNRTEWIISVSMLTEGWDVKNVFQIVPWEDRAFNSKLLIAQVLGRGLRIPEAYNSSQPKVIVFNHDSWSKNIVSLVNEVLEIETTITSEIIETSDREKYNFDLHHLDYTKKDIEKVRAASPVFDYSKMEKEGIKLDSQAIISKKQTSYVTALPNYSTREQFYSIKHEVETIEEIIDKIYTAFEIRDWEGRILKLGEEEYTQNDLPPREKIKEIILKSMQAVGIRGDELVKSNASKIYSAFGTLLRKKNKFVVYDLKINNYFLIYTKNMNKENLGIGNLRNKHSLFYTSDWKNEIEDEKQKRIIEDVINDKSLPNLAVKEKNEFLFKTPLNLVFTNGSPERKFVDHLCEKEIANKINSWVKSRDRGFYSIEYSLKYGNEKSKTRKYSKLNNFNPDFFISAQYNGKEYILVVETKADKDDSKENRAKYEFAKKHFEVLNEKLKEQGIKQEYIFHFLSPNGYAEFFDYLKDGRLFEEQSNFRCELENMLEGNGVDNPLLQDE